MRPSSLVAAAMAFGLLAGGCSHQDKAADAKSAPSPVPLLPAPQTPARPAASLAAPALVDAASAWDAISGLPYDQRPAFVAGMSRMEAVLDSQIDALKQKRATMTTGTTDWDLAMGSVTDARNYLHSLVTEVNGLTNPDAWDQEKDRVHQAWTRAEDACDKVRTSTTG